MKELRASRRILVLLVLAGVMVVQAAAFQKARRPSQKGGAHAAGISEKEERPDRKPGRRTEKALLPYTAGGRVAVRFDSERGVFQNSGRWTHYPDGIYLEPQEDAIYMIGSRSAAADDISSFVGELFTKYRGYADSICPSKVSDRLQDPAFRSQVGEAYREAAESQRQLFNRTLSYEEYVANIPDCDVGGNLWRSAIRFADEGWKRVLVRFPDDAPIRSSFSSNPAENHLHLLKARLRSEGRLFRSPLTAGEP